MIVDLEEAPLKHPVFILMETTMFGEDVPVAVYSTFDLAKVSMQTMESTSKHSTYSIEEVDGIGLWTLFDTEELRIDQCH